MSRFPDDLRERQSICLKMYVQRSGYSQEIAAARMGIPYEDLRRVINGHVQATPYFLMRMFAALEPPVASCTEDTLREQLSSVVDILSAAAWFEHGRGMQRNPRVWKRRPPPLASACEVTGGR